MLGTQVFSRDGRQPETQALHEQLLCVFVATEASVIKTVYKKPAPVWFNVYRT